METYTENEICRIWHSSRRDRRQIGILSDLTGLRDRTIEDILKRNNFDIPKRDFLTPEEAELENVKAERDKYKQDLEEIYKFIAEYNREQLMKQRRLYES